MSDHVRRRCIVRFLARPDVRTLKAARLDNSVEAEMRARAGVEVLILDDFALQAMDLTERATSTRSSSKGTRRPAPS